jgi:hypothetical protein
MALARATGQEVAAALEAQVAVGSQAQTGVRAVELLLDDDVPTPQRRQGHLLQVLVSRLQARAREVGRARIFDDGVHLTKATQTM